MKKTNTAMHLTNDYGVESDRSHDSVGFSRFYGDSAYEDEATFKHPLHQRNQGSRELASRRAQTLEDDDIADIALHFGDR